MSDAKAKRLSELILSEGDSPELAPLRLAMRMEGPQFAQAMFCWKAVLYYRWRSRSLGPEMKLTRRSMASIDASRFDVETGVFVRNAVMQLENLTTDCERRIAEMFRIYDEVFDALTEQRTPEPFRRFLVDGPKMFSRLGERMGRLEQLVSFWQHQFPGRSVRQLSPEIVFDGLRALLSARSLGTSLLEMRREETAVVWNSGDIEARVAPRRGGGAHQGAASQPLHRKARSRRRRPGLGYGRRMQRKQAIDLNAGGQSRPFHYRPGGSDERVIAEVLKHREYDFARLRRGPELNDLYNRIVGAGKTPLIIDAGANIGASAIWFAYTFPAAQLVAIEPEAENFSPARSQHPGDASSSPCRRRSAPGPGVLFLIDHSEEVAWGFRTAAPDGGASSGAVEAITVNDIYAERAGPCVPFIAKIDIEGGETDVFSAATEWVAQTPVIIIELHDWLLTGQASARPFLQCVSALDRDFVYVGENVFSIDNQLEQFAPLSLDRFPTRPTTGTARPAPPLARPRWPAASAWCAPRLVRRSRRACRRPP